MALWKETPAPAASASAAPSPGRSAPAADNDAARRMPPSASAAPAPSAPAANRNETVISSGLTTEGKIGGEGDVRVAGKFKGDVSVDGHCRIDAGGILEGQVKASMAVIGGELQGGIHGAKNVDLLATGVIVGDVKADVLTVAMGSRMRGNVDIGWDQKRKV